MILTFTVGCSGSGKTTWAKEEASLARDTVRVCPDELRAIVGKDESDQSKNFLVFQIAYAMTEYLLRQGFNVIFDATSYTKRARKTLVDIARKTDSVCECVFFQTPIEVAKARNSKRDRQVPESVIEKQVAGLEKPNEIEGFSIEYIN